MESLVSRLHDKNVCVKNVIFGENYLFLTADRKDLKNIFAICRNMCYNVKRIRYTGEYSLLYYAAKNVGAILGALVFFALTYISDFFVAEVAFTGDAAGFRREITAALKSEGIEKGKFCFKDLSRAGEKIALSTDGIAYATIEKRGKTIIAFARRESVAQSPVDVKRKEIRSTVSGVVKAVNCLSGTAAVKVGDEVNAGDVLIRGTFTNKAGEEFQTYALGEISVLTPVVYEYTAAEESELYERRALFLAKQSVENREIESEKIEFSKKSGKPVYTVTLTVIEYIN